MLVGNNVRIRPMEKKDLELFYDWMSNQESVGCFSDATMTYKEPFIERLETALKDKNKLYTIIEDSNANPIGMISYSDVVGSPSALEIGILIGKSSARGNGLGRESLDLFVKYIFTTKPIIRIQFLTRADNAGMRAIGEKVGFVLEGVLKKYKYVQGDYRDFCIMAITREEWDLKNSSM